MESKASDKTMSKDVFEKLKKSYIVGGGKKVSIDDKKKDSKPVPPNNDELGRHILDSKLSKELPKLVYAKVSKDLKDGGHKVPRFDESMKTSILLMLSADKNFVDLVKNKNDDKVIQFMKKAMKGKHGEGLLDTVKSGFKALYHGVNNVAKGTFNIIVNTGNNFVHAIKKRFSGGELLKTLGAIAVNAIKNSEGGLAGIVGGVVEGLTETVGDDLAGSFKDAVKAQFADTVDKDPVENLKKLGVALGDEEQQASTPPRPPSPTMPPTDDGFEVIDKEEIDRDDDDDSPIVGAGYHVINRMFNRILKESEK